MALCDVPLGENKLRKVSNANDLMAKEKAYKQLHGIVLVVACL